MAYQQFARYGEWRLLFFLSSRQQAFVKPSQAWFVSAGHQCGHVQGKPNPTRVIPLEVPRFVLACGLCTPGYGAEEPLFDFKFIAALSRNLRSMNRRHLRQQDRPLTALGNEDHTHPVHPYPLHTGKDCVFP